MNSRQFSRYRKYKFVKNEVKDVRYRAVEIYAIPQFTASCYEVISHRKGHDLLLFARRDRDQRRRIENSRLFEPCRKGGGEEGVGRHHRLSVQ